MATKIEWADETWNPVTGCTKVSSGCANCYAERFAGRAMREWKGRKFSEVRCHEDRLSIPLRMKKPRRIFVNSMSDLFHPDVPESFIDRVLAVVALCPQHCFQVLTKRPERMLRYIAQRKMISGGTLGGVIPWKTSCDWVYRCILDAGRDLPPDGLIWPLPNLWLGVSVEGQATADQRIPLLLEAPAARRFVSCEPLLGEVDLTGWGSEAPDRDFSKVPEKWSDFVWPEWVPADQRKHIEEFWGETYSRSPRSWMRDHVDQRVPRTGAVITVSVDGHGWGRANKMATAGVRGRYLHCWNNVGRLVLEDGTTIPVSGGSGSAWMSQWLNRSGDYEHKLNWIICGGESGPGARPFNVDWARSLRDQCKAASVPFFLKQLGANVRGYSEACWRCGAGDWGAIEYGPGRHPGYWNCNRCGADSTRLHDPKGATPAEWPEDLWNCRELPV